MKPQRILFDAQYSNGKYTEINLSDHMSKSLVPGFSGAGEAAAGTGAGSGVASRFFSSDFAGAASSFFDGNACGSGIFSLSNDFCDGTSVAATAGTSGDFASPAAAVTAGAAVDDAASCGTGFDAQMTSNALSKQTWNDFILNGEIKGKNWEKCIQINVKHNCRLNQLLK